MILTWKENKEPGAICLEIRIPGKKEQGIIKESPTRNAWKLFDYGK